MGHVCTHDGFPRSPKPNGPNGPNGTNRPKRPNGEHPVTAALAILAIVLAILLIAWARVEVHGTQDLEALVEEQPVVSNTGPAENEAASSRWATGFSH
jgi:hypothetical protein